MPNKIDGFKLLNFASQIEEGTLEQAKLTAQMPFVKPHVALMPDVHVGIGSSVGAVIPTVSAVIPAAVGVDIGCGMVGAQTIFSKSDLAGRSKRALRESLEAAIPLSPGNYNDHLDRFDFTAARIRVLEDMAEHNNVDLSHSPRWREQLGSLGGGNHFIEGCLDNRGDRMWMFLHSGSRGVGNKIAQKHIKIAKKLCAMWHVPLPDPDLAFLPQGAPEFANYIKELNWAQKFALANREEMMDRFRLVLAQWIGWEEDPAKIEVDRINCHHNYTRVEHHMGQSVWVTRKGAIDAHMGVRGIIPGSMGKKSYVVRGKGNVAGLCSAPHGAGRQFSRTRARELFTAQDLADAMVGIEYRPGVQWVDEHPGAYKDIDQVMADAADLVDIECELRQFINVKGE